MRRASTESIPVYQPPFGLPPVRALRIDTILAELRRMHRRTFLASALAGPFVASLRAAAPGVRLGYDTYSLRAWGWKALQHLDYSARLNLDAIQISSLNDFESLEPAHLAAVRRKAEDAGILIDAGIGCVCPSSKSWGKRTDDPVASVTQGLKVAHAVGARSLRCFMGSSEDRLGPLPIEAHIENTVKVFKSARSVALDTGVKIAIENHSGDMQAWETKMLIEEAGKDYVAACLDAGNPIQAVEDPIVTMEVLGPLTVTTHIRDTALYEDPRGCAFQWTALGDGNIDLPRLLALKQQLCPQAAVQLEIITGRPARVIPYLEPDFWKAFPKARSSEFARFVALVKKGRPYAGPMIIADVPGPRPAEYAAALKEQQRVDLDRSLIFAKQKLGLGKA
jgi:3-oxoisoapionate decarboxylase